MQISVRECLEALRGSHGRGAARPYQADESIGVKSFHFSICRLTFSPGD